MAPSAATRNHAVAAQPQPLRRSARLQTAAVAAQAPPKPEDEFRVLKTTKRKPERYDCTTCDRNLSASSFPKYLPTDNCKHLINTCKACTKTHIAVMMDSVTYDKLACPECPELLTNADVKRQAAKDVYKRYDELERRGISEKVPGWRWCLNPECRGGQVHESLLTQEDPPKQDSATARTKKDEKAKGKEPQTKRPSKAKKIVRLFVDLTSANPPVDEKDQKDIFTCKTCGHRACVPCDRPFHNGETCIQYKQRLGQAEANSEKSQKTIEKYCKPCPKCGKKIEKNGGCDAMICPCGERFCWLCLVPYATINATGHDKECRYAAGNNRFDPHAGPGAPGQAALW
ncbi:hypothetical protein KC318_g6342 [Hortaea werneckii]|uniref:RBR-type E3 ubiquitin transferase n=1 Tax=Hortaea werneckii TaxID=91943 RepID=A0A3M6YDC0_HORWE|nr:hypothetical protein KC334_g6524 [Hortaea werneckii]KAI7010086.1 hypothetical protein KC355_g6320 [Hortaea werneckii]KAI7666709.1 hypothetical protein KC318_g6342 [Hortaea werneckii]RMY01046.1 hypothetical protein D0867_11527 [Hortaea werneckii]RMY22435.1 hypothetical protein D0866_11940 [Hortaea werneckii]